MQQKSAQAENELWDAVGEALDMEMSTVEDVLESLARTQKGNVKSSTDTTGKTVIILVNLHTWVLIIMERTAGSPVSFDF